MAALYEMRGILFKPQAYEKAAMGVEEADEELAQVFKKNGVEGLLEIPGFGEGISAHVAELLTTGHLKKYERLKKELPIDIADLTQIPGVGPKTVMTLYKKLGIRTVDDLEKAARNGKIADLPHFGEQSQLKILRGITFYTSHHGRYPLGSVYPIALRLLKQMEQSDLFNKIEIGGSFRRMKETVGDLDMLATAKDPAKAMQYFVSVDGIAEVIQFGETKSEIRLDCGLQVDIRIVPGESHGSALQYFTGNKAHNIKLRTIAIQKGFKLNEYGIFRGKKRIAGRTEKEVYETLGLEYVPPELRTDTGEIEAALSHKLPRLIEYGDCIGDLQTQTNWTDGRNSIEEMADAARRLGRKYIAITDHTRSLAITGGSDEERLLRQMKEIDRLNKTVKDITILKGAEVNIMKDGSLDIEDEVLAKLDVVGVAVHSHFSMSRADMTKRIVRAISNLHVNILFHPTARVINQRQPIDFDFEEVLKVAKKHGVAMEIDAHPYRLDLHDSMIRQAVEAGVKLVIDSDAHNVHELDFLHFGEAQARRGWATAADVLNTLELKDLLAFFNKPKDKV